MHINNKVVSKKYLNKKIVTTVKIMFVAPKLLNTFYMSAFLSSEV